jgi:hypothetical protein
MMFFTGTLLGTLFGPFLPEHEPPVGLLARSGVGWVALAVTFGVFNGTGSLMRDGIAARRSKTLQQPRKEIAEPEPV